MGTLLVLASIVFVVERFWFNALWRGDWWNPEQLVLPLLAGTLFYLFGSLLLGSAWWLLISRLGEPGLAWKLALKIHGKSQLAKYIPGNIFHLLSRHGYGIIAGLGHRSQLLALLLETGLCVLAAACMALPLYAATAVGSVLSVCLLAATLTTAARLVPPVAVRLLSSLAVHRGMPDEVEPGRPLLLAVRWSYLLYSGFFFLSAAITILLVHAITADVSLAAGSLSLPLVAAITATAWLIGFITPGASAGFGVREATLILLLEPHLGSGSATLIALSFRLITIAGDTGYFLLASLIGTSANPQQPSSNPGSRHV
ncbi:MAG: hypothetical protein OQK94_04360 [Gammaproteobacteria bacterium]|nr:hypothetical protein [Gammaproteobacteria bacterium]MCW8839650.1 hypothetical protein [Gammaproteobacteria bacterium]MCW8927244.1 hypothetical protein [Gammaproteobacteria bacterium]MCW8957659.1 hypothetical protein [Gammaproteobacteria bacterium]MCW8971710.1 hypothetical protein [Gammaproteobacteria bacterium]